MASLSRALTSWYAKAQRALPFRENSDAYRIWVSEIMAQQTRIAALLPYFTRFVERFPTVQALAEAPEDEVLKAWEGLGYYSRARHLRAAAILLVQNYHGRLPEDYKTLRNLPGIGDYTAGAILSIAFGQAVPAVDGNVQRVHARLLCHPALLGSPEAKKAAERFCRMLMETEAPSQVTQALMELGALICLPKAPRCASCPLTVFCRAHTQGVETQYPKKAQKKHRRVETRPVYLILDNELRILMRRRTETLLNGLWEYPDHLPETMASYTPEPCGRATHIFTHIVWEMEGFVCQVPRMPPPEGYVWVGPEYETLAIPTAFRAFTRKILKIRAEGTKSVSPKRLK